MTAVQLSGQLDRSLDQSDGPVPAAEHLAPTDEFDRSFIGRCLAFRRHT